MKRNAAGLVLAALAVTGCSSVDQVPLVYVSTAKVGVNVESGSAETPGASILIGVDLTDAAYVPVAVARKCDDQTGNALSRCVDSVVQIAKIFGTSNDVTENDREKYLGIATEARVLEEQISQADTAYRTALSDEESRQKELTEAKAAKSFIESFAYDEASDDFSKLPPDAQEKYRTEKARADSLAGLETAVERSRQESGRRLQALNERRQSLLELAKKLEESVPLQNSTALRQNDALSVFGTFSGDINGSAGQDSGANVRLGKSFSTGVAAQNLARGVADSSVELAKNRSNCLSSVATAFESLKPEERTTATLEKLLARC
ncbi:hypothetical protein [Qipengyuania flava]|uniref:hypothetical protein n=1 Tax=Qipengyuania flava TaxID=192812 RepID=UPI001C6328E8|nr:hypothetical protein [Qipengyuania flava]QYJ06494.1 hypothetical protein KUV82_10495 [Qipengyuania flava]